jgi:hypothetical protein
LTPSPVAECSGTKTVEESVPSKFCIVPDSVASNVTVPVEFSFRVKLSKRPLHVLAKGNLIMILDESFVSMILQTSSAKVHVVLIDAILTAKEPLISKVDVGDVVAIPTCAFKFEKLNKISSKTVEVVIFFII